MPICQLDPIIEIWNIEQPYKVNLIASLVGHYKIVMSLLFIQKHNKLITGSHDNTLRLWNMNNYQCESVFNGINCYFINSLCQIDEK